MSSEAVSGDHQSITTQIIDPVPRSKFMRAAVWINSHPKSTFLAFCVLAAGYGLALGFGGLSQDVFVGVAAGGGVALLVTAVVLARLIWMPEEKRLQYLLGINRPVQNGDAIYFCDQNGHFHNVVFTIDGRGSFISFDEACASFFQTGNSLSHSFTSPSDPILHHLREFVLAIDANSPRGQLAAIFDVLEDHAPKKCTVDGLYEVEFYQDGENWNIKMPTAMYQDITQDYQATGPTHECRLVGPRYIHSRIATYLREAEANHKITNWFKQGS